MANNRVTDEEKLLRKQYLLKLMGVSPARSEASCDALLEENCMRFTDQEIESLMDLAIAKASDHLSKGKQGQDDNTPYK